MAGTEPGHDDGHVKFPCFGRGAAHRTSRVRDVRIDDRKPETSELRAMRCRSEATTSVAIVAFRTMPRGNRRAGAPDQRCITACCIASGARGCGHTQGRRANPHPPFPTSGITITSARLRRQRAPTAPLTANEGACARCRFAHSATATVSASSCGPWTPGLARCARPGNGFADIDAVGRLRACGANPRYGVSHRERRRARTCRFAHPAAGTKTRLYAPPSCPRRGRPRLERRSASKT